MLDVTDPGTPAEPTPAVTPPAAATAAAVSVAPAVGNLKVALVSILSIVLTALAPTLFRAAVAPFAAVVKHEASLSQLAVAVSLYGEQLAALVEDVADTKVDDAKSLDQLAQAVNLYGLDIRTNASNISKVGRDFTQFGADVSEQLARLESKIPPPAPPLPPASDSPFGAALVAHWRGLPAEILKVKDGVSKGEIKTAQDIVAAFSVTAKPQSEAMASAVMAHADATTGKITDVPGLVKALQQAADFVGAAK